LLSSYLIYNQIGNLDENSLNNISVILNLAKEIVQKNNIQDANLFPTFLWVLRDFGLNLEDKNNTKISAK